MRKIISQEARVKKTKRNQLIVGIVLIGILLFSVLGYALGGRSRDGNSEKIEYNRIEFIKDNSGYWHFNIQGIDFVTKYNPEETQDISFFIYSNINNYVNKPLYFVSKYAEPNTEIVVNLNALVLRMHEACLPESAESECGENLPVKNCSVDNIIIIRESEDKGNETEGEGIYQDENCVFIVANLGNQTKYADAFLFKILGI